MRNRHSSGQGRVVRFWERGVRGNCEYRFPRLVEIPPGYQGEINREFLASLPVIQELEPELIRCESSQEPARPQMKQAVKKAPKYVKKAPEGCKTCPPVKVEVNVTGNNNGGRGGQAVINNGSPGANATNGPEVKSNNGPKPKQEGPPPAASINSSPPVVAAPPRAAAPPVKVVPVENNPPAAIMPIGT